ncbi:Bro-N domain-containing protein [Haematospirillum sp. 15-248]|uniref:BRO-N domain-containing protein n=1 Tax=Haematospirillum sp. 15-248 TaxID=2723107 RepID=UPI0014390221|nr:Bro-N domain-containing protein [Haematospirillum sp. 15-248]NKD88174.1 Bro-N domain-containing protein [Haematospirillum sp. 15-248]
MHHSNAPPENNGAVTDIFVFEDCRIRTLIDKNGEPWFVAKDVCDVLGIIKYRDAIARLDDDQKSVGIADTPGGPQRTTIINEPGLYSLALSHGRPPEKWLRTLIVRELFLMSEER